MSNKKKEIIAFVYGTLKEGGFFAWRLDPFRISSVKGTIKASLHDGPYPMIIDGEDDVHGEIHVYNNTDDAALETLDAIEGYNEKSLHNLYERRLVDAVGEDGETYKAYAYYVAHETLKERCKNGEYKKIESGVWEESKL